MPWHQKIKSYLMETGFNSLDVRVRGSSWGMACNSIHFIDLVCWWTGASIVSVEVDRLSINLGYLLNEKGFYEVNGILSVRFSDFSSLVCECSLWNPSCQIEVGNPVWFFVLMSLSVLHRHRLVWRFRVRSLIKVHTCCTHTIA